MARSDDEVFLEKSLSVNEQQEQLLVEEAKSEKMRVEKFCHAASQGDTDHVKLEIESGMNVHAINATGSTALIVASQSGQAEIVKLLLDNGVAADFQNQTNQQDKTSSSIEVEALSLACREGHLDIVQLLVSAGFRDRDASSMKIQTNDSALVSASKQGHSPVVRYLLDQGFDPNATIKYSFVEEQYGQKKDNGEASTSTTPLIAAVENNHLEVCKLLIGSGGADVNKEGKHGDTPYKVAKRLRRKEILEYLIEHGAIKPKEMTKSNGLKIDKFASLNDNLLKGPGNLVDQSRDKGSVTRD